jgi:hypothetical protein
MGNGQPQSAVCLNLSRNASIVLFEFLSRFTDTTKLSIEDQAEQRVLWDICCMLESELHEPISPDYAEILKCARSAIRDASD